MQSATRFGYRLNQLPVQGRDPSCDIVLHRPAVSRRHARLTFRDGARILDDLGSTIGTV